LARWIYTHFAARAYQAFLDLGRGMLVGPFLTDPGKNLITREDAIHRHEIGTGVGLTVTYLAVNDPLFEQTLPDPALRRPLLGAVDKYIP
jgi:hypothetical protein